MLVWILSFTKEERKRKGRKKGKGVQTNNMIVNSYQPWATEFDTTVKGSFKIFSLINVASWRFTKFFSFFAILLLPCSGMIEYFQSCFPLSC